MVSALLYPFVGSKKNLKVDHMQKFMMEMVYSSINEKEKGIKGELWKSYWIL